MEAQKVQRQLKYLKYGETPKGNGKNVLGFFTSGGYEF